nr:MAG TPA: hypothetical protein [Bacteriophage sp.]
MNPYHFFHIPLSLFSGTPTKICWLSLPFFPVLLQKLRKSSF